MNRLSREQVEQWLADAQPSASVYLVGAGGCGMSGLAHLLLDLGLAVQGSDLRDHAGLRLLCERGAVVHEGHAPEQLRAAQPDLVVYSSAIRMDNPELALAQQLGIPLVRRAVLLAALAHQRRAVCVRACMARPPRLHCWLTRWSNWRHRPGSQWVPGCRNWGVRPE